MHRFHHTLLRVCAIVSVLCCVHGFAVRPVLSTTSSRRLSSTARLFVQPKTAVDQVSTKKDNDTFDEDDKAYQRKRALTFFVADSFTFGFVVFAVVGVSGGILNALGYGYVVTPDGTLLIDTLEHFRMQHWMDAVPPLAASNGL